MAMSKGDYLQVENDPLTSRTVKGPRENDGSTKREILNTLLPSQPSLHDFEFNENLAAFFDNRDKLIEQPIERSSSSKKETRGKNLGKIFPLLKKKSYTSFELPILNNNFIYSRRREKTVRKSLSGEISLWQGIKNGLRQLFSFRKVFRIHSSSATFNSSGLNNDLSILVNNSKGQSESEEKNEALMRKETFADFGRINKKIIDEQTLKNIKKKNIENAITLFLSAGQDEEDEEIFNNENFMEYQVARIEQMIEYDEEYFKIQPQYNLYVTEMNGLERLKYYSDDLPLLNLRKAFLYIWE